MASERAFDLDCVRTLRSFSPSDLCGLEAQVHWCEWRHEHEGSRGLHAQVADAVKANWPRFIKPGSIAIDIGAHSGDTAVPLGIFVRDRERNKPGTVIAIEPNPGVFAVLDINLTLNSHLAHYIAIQAAVTAADCDEIELSDFGTSLCNTGIISDKFDMPRQIGLRAVTKNTFKTKGLSLASVLRENVAPEKISDVSFIKIDCEGYDKEILEAARDVLAVVRPALYVEWFAGFSEGESEDLFRVIDFIGYKPFDPISLQAATVKDRISDLMLLPAERARELVP